ncbi:MAG: porin family protein [Gammaproteobacteria bacterium]|nr:porin family protein [Gammaproteobacteria bacterium]MCK5262896.1 porin family protein [Gammaproteobacteria bacterium]
MRKLSAVLILMLVAGSSYAAKADKIYLGGGLGFNSISGIDFSDGLGFQIFGGYDLPVKMGKGKLSLEVGYMDSGDMEVAKLPAILGGATIEGKATGLWGNAVYSLPLQDKMNFIARAGLDIGDDDGLMIGAGLGFKINHKIEIRGEYVIRDTIDSLQINMVMRM